MAAFTGTPTSSTQYAAQINAAEGMVRPNYGPLTLAPFDYTHAAAAGAGTGEVNLVRLPPGKVRIYPSLSYLAVADLAANATLDLGHRAYFTSAGATVVEDDNEWIDNSTVHTGPIVGPWTGGFETGFTGTTSEVATDYDAASGLVIFASIDVGDIETGDTITGWVAFQKLP